MKIQWTYELKNPKLAIKTSYKLDNLVKEKKIELDNKLKELENMKKQVKELENNYYWLINTRFFLDHDIQVYYANKINDNKEIEYLMNKRKQFLENRKTWSCFMLANFLKLYKKVF